MYKEDGSESHHVDLAGYSYDGLHALFKGLFRTKEQVEGKGRRLEETAVLGGGVAGAAVLDGAPPPDTAGSSKSASNTTAAVQLEGASANFRSPSQLYDALAPQPASAGGVGAENLLAGASGSRRLALAEPSPIAGDAAWVPLRPQQLLLGSVVLLGALFVASASARRHQRRRRAELHKSAAASLDETGHEDEFTGCHVA